MDMQTQSWPRWLNKRDDSRVAFDSSKIERAIERLVRPPGSWAPRRRTS